MIEALTGMPALSTQIHQYKSSTMEAVRFKAQTTNLRGSITRIAKTTICKSITKEAIES